MTRRRFYAPPDAFNVTEQTVTLGPEETRHLRDVLRLKNCDEVYVFDGQGREFRCAISRIKRDTTELQVESQVGPANPESHLQLNLCVALLKGEKFDLVVQKATELGVVRVVPVMTRLADIKLKDESDANKRVTRWRRIALEAAKQSGRAFVPEITVPVAFAELISAPKSNDRKVLFSERQGESFDSMEHKHGPMTALVGSEGGWTKDELDAAETAGWKLITLGGRTLRAETAAIAVATLLQHRFGDLN